ncbi:MAG: hypothetical protein ACOY4O_11370 [Pseudomonadota bacterium]|jgi:hypothetical protein
MTENSTDPAKAAKVAQKIVDILINEDAATRQRSIQAAMLLLGEPMPSSATIRLEQSHDEPAEAHSDLASFFNRDEDLKPSDYGYLCAAYHFSQFGAAPFSITEIRAIATEAGVIIPDRLDMTFRQAAKKGKKLFQDAGKSSFKPTATGGLEFGERWGVKPGRKSKSAPSAKTSE